MTADYGKKLDELLTTKAEKQRTQEEDAARARDRRLQAHTEFTTYVNTLIEPVMTTFARMLHGRDIPAKVVLPETSDPHDFKDKRIILRISPSGTP